VWRREIDLQVGDVVQIGSQCLIVLEAHDGEVTVKVCATEDYETEDWSTPAPR
jgi:hypothetical protein